MSTAQSFEKKFKRQKRSIICLKLENNDGATSST